MDIHKIIWWIVTFVANCILCIKIQDLQVPVAIRSGEDAVLGCLFETEGDVLYSIKWYKGRREFFRYTLRENPPLKTFEVAGINVNKSQSNITHIYLSSIRMSAAGKYTFVCEVSADAPSFSTSVVAKEMEVVEIPPEPPTITGIGAKYDMDDIVVVNCTSKNSKPGANLTWTLNNVPINSREVYNFKSTNNSLDTTTTGLQFRLSSHHFSRGPLKIKCTASILNIYNKSTEATINGDPSHWDHFDNNITYNWIPGQDLYNYPHVQESESWKLHHLNAYHNSMKARSSPVLHVHFVIYVVYIALIFTR